MDDGYSGAWQQINPEMSRMELPDGWLIITRVHLVVGGKDYHAVSNPILYHDPLKKWRIKSK